VIIYHTIKTHSSLIRQSDVIFLNVDLQNNIYKFILVCNSTYSKLYISFTFI